MRIPSPAVSVVDLVVELDKEATAETINEALKNAAANELNGIMGFSEEPLVSVDYKQDCRSSIVDGLSTMVMEGKMAKIVSWYDNEWGYSNRVADLISYIVEKGL